MLLMCHLVLSCWLLALQHRCWWAEVLWVWLKVQPALPGHVAASSHRSETLLWDSTTSSLRDFLFTIRAKKEETKVLIIVIFRLLQIKYLTLFYNVPTCVILDWEQFNLTDCFQLRDIYCRTLYLYIIYCFIYFTNLNVERLLKSSKNVKTFSKSLSVLWEFKWPLCLMYKIIWVIADIFMTNHKRVL